MGFLDGVDTAQNGKTGLDTSLSSVGGHSPQISLDHKWRRSKSVRKATLRGTLVSGSGRAEGLGGFGCGTVNRL